MRADGREHVVEPGCEAAELTRLIRLHEPHLILTEWGDDYLFAALSRLPGFGAVPLNRDGAPVAPRGRARSYFTYGKVVYSGPAYFLRGRWHVDRETFSPAC